MIEHEPIEMAIRVPFLAWRFHLLPEDHARYVTRGPKPTRIYQLHSSNSYPKHMAYLIIF